MKEHRLFIALLLALAGFPQISETIYTPALPSVARGLSTTASLVEGTLSIFFLGFATGVTLWGVCSDWWGRRKAMLAGILIYGLATFACMKAETVGSLLFWRFFQAFGASVGSVITQTILRDCFQGDARTKVFSLITGALALSPAIGPLLGGYVSEYFGWRANFLLLSCLSVVLLLWTFWALPETRPLKQPLTITPMANLFYQMLKNRNLWGHVLLISATNGILFGFYQEAPFIFINHLGLSPGQYGFFGFLIASATILSSRLTYRRVKEIGHHAMIKRGAVLTLLGGGLFLTIILLNSFNSSWGIALSLLPLFLIFFGIGLIIPNSLSHALQDYQQNPGTAGSLFGGCYYSFLCLFTWILSILHTGSLTVLPAYIIAMGSILAIASRQVSTKNPSQKLARS